MERGREISTQGLQGLNKVIGCQGAGPGQIVVWGESKEFNAYPGGGIFVILVYSPITVHEV